MHLELTIIGRQSPVVWNKIVTPIFADQAVKSLCDIWHLEDIPHVFRTSCEDSTIPNDEKTSRDIPLMQLPLRNTQLPSPASPNSQPSPFASPSISLNVTSPSGCIRTDHLLPIRGFVHEVLRRSRTSTGVLQTALCYLEAVRSKVPGILEQERLKQAHPELYQEADPAQRIVLGTDLDFDDITPRTDRSAACNDPVVDDVVDRYQGPLTAPPTEIISDSGVDFNIPPPVSTAASKAPCGPLPPPTGSSTSPRWGARPAST